MRGRVQERDAQAIEQQPLVEPGHVNLTFGRGNVGCGHLAYASAQSLLCVVEEDDDLGSIEIVLNLVRERPAGRTDGPRAQPPARIT